MKPTSVTVKILEQIRDAAQQTNMAIDATNTRIDATNERLEEVCKVMLQGFDALTHRVVESEIRMATVMTGIAGTLHDTKELLEDRLGLKGRVERCEQDIVVLKERAGVK